MENGNANVNVVDDLKLYQERQRKLADILSGASEAIRSLKMSKERDLADLSNKVQNDIFKVMVTGTFKNGKSTFINALLGEEILPAYALPCTAIINEVKYGADKKAILHFRSPLPNPLPEKLAERAVRHMNAYKGKEIPPLEIPYDEIEDYVVIPMGADEKQMKLQSPYEKVELYYPLELLKNGVEIIDSPGLNEDETRTYVTMDYLSSVDAILYVLNATGICARDEMDFVKYDLQGNGFESVFFVINRIDQVRPESQQCQILQYAKLKLKEVYRDPEVFAISALNALDGRLNHDDDMVEKSGILSLESRLSAFLTKEKGKAKLAQPAKRVRQILSSEALEVVLPRERALLDTSLDDVKKRYDSVKPRLDHLQLEKVQRQQEMYEKIERSARKFERMAKRNISDLINEIPAWIDEFTPATSLGAVPTKGKTEQVIGEITDYLKEKITESQNDWKENVLKQEIEDESNSVFQSAERDISRIYDEIDDINVELAGNNNYNANPVPFWQRAVGVVGGWAIGGVGLAVSGGINGIGKELAVTAAFEVGAGALLAILGCLNPFTITAVLIAVFLGNMGRGSSRALEKLKSQVTDLVIDELSKGADEQASGLADGIRNKFREVADQIIDSVSREISDVDTQMQAIMTEMKRGKESVNTRKKELDECEKKIHSLNTELDTLIFALVGA